MKYSKISLQCAVIFMVLAAMCSAALAKIEIKFTPSRECENKIVRLIDGAKSTIDVAVYSINNKQIIDALLRADMRGVKIRILTDRLQAAGKASKVKYLHNQGINIRVHSKNKIEHNKFAVFDANKATTGSYNWTNPASEKNSENCVFFIRNKEAVQSYQTHFDYLWRINTKQKSEEWFAKQK